MPGLALTIPSAFNAIISASVVALGVSYAIPPAINCLRGRKMLPPRPFVLPGPLGWICNLLGISYVTVTTVLFLFPPTLPVTGSNMSTFVRCFCSLHCAAIAAHHPNLYISLPLSTHPPRFPYILPSPFPPTSPPSPSSTKPIQQPTHTSTNNAPHSDYCIVAFFIVIVISVVQWFIDGRKNYKGPVVELVGEGEDGTVYAADNLDDKAEGAHGNGAMGHVNGNG